MRAIKVLGVLATLIACGMPASAQEAVKDAAQGPAKVPHRKWRDIQMPPLRQFTAPKPERHVLPNGLVLFLIEDHELPTVDLVTLVRTGQVYETRDKAGMAAIAGEVMRTGGTTSK